jgi:hypothetical protein
VNAPEFCEYLRNRHRHIFVIRCKFHVCENNREIEINEQQNKIDKYLKTKYGYPCEFWDMSCEDICEDVMNNFTADMVEVLEDDYGGAAFTR